MSYIVPGIMNAKHAGYHKSCCVQFLVETEDQEGLLERIHLSTTLKVHLNLSFLYQDEEQVVEQHSVLVSYLVCMYQEQFSSVGGNVADIQATVQCHPS